METTITISCNHYGFGGLGMTLTHTGIKIHTVITGTPLCLCRYWYYIGASYSGLGEG